MENKIYFVTCNSWCGETRLFDTEREARNEVEDRLADDFRMGETNNVYTIYEGIRCVSAEIPKHVEPHWF